jgi:putative transposase
MPFRTAQRWVALYHQYHQFGLTALVRRKPADRGGHRSSGKIRKAIEGLPLQKPPLPIAALYREVRRLAEDLGEELPS